MSRQKDKLRIYVTGRGWLRAAPTMASSGKLCPKFTTSKRLAREYDSIRSAAQMAGRVEPFARVPEGCAVAVEIWHDEVRTEVIHKGGMAFRMLTGRLDACTR